MKKYFQVIFIFLSISLPSKVLSESEIILSIKGVEQAILVEVADIIKRRFMNIKTGFFSSVETTLHGYKVSLKFSGWSPTKEQIQYLIATQGSLEVFVSGNKPQRLITEQDVKSAEGFMSNEVALLGLELSQVAAQTMAEKTKNLAGAEVEFHWDGEVHSQLRIDGPMSKFVSLTIASIQEAQLMAAVLNNGKLPTDIRIKRVKK